VRALLDATAVDCFARCIERGGVVLFPADTVYGLACDPCQSRAVARLYELKGRPPAQPAAVMFFALAPALAALPELGPRTRAALEALLPGPLTALLPNPAERYPLASGPRSVTLGLRVPSLPPTLAALSAVHAPVLQSSANLSGGAEARRLADVESTVRAGVDLELDGGELPGFASTVLDLCEYERHGRWQIVREGPLTLPAVRRLLGAPDGGRET
jgi:L-threonylcarbamoyladenylate synthase